jgi:hypothetical protein
LLTWDDVHLELPLGFKEKAYRWEETSKARKGETEKKEDENS